MSIQSRVKSSQSNKNRYNYQSWQESLDPKLTRRLLRPIAQPGVASTQLVESILLRMQAMTERSPLAKRLLQRQYWVPQRSADAVPIVYARTASNNRGQSVSATDLQPSAQQSAKLSPKKQLPLVIQAKFARPQERSPNDFSGSTIDTQSEGDSRASEMWKLPLIQAKSAIQPVQNVVKTLPVVRENSKGSRLLARSAPTASVAQSATGQKPIVQAKNNTNPSSERLGANSTGKTLGVVQPKLERPVVRENSRTDEGRSPVPLVFASPSTSKVPPASNGLDRTGILPVNNHTSNNGVIQRMSSPDSELTSSPPVPPTPVIEQNRGGGDAESTDTSNEVDVEDLVDRVQRRLMQRLTIETERRGLRRWI
ncbi:MAG: hypothetical protein AB4426_25655 [Xenococcaceae cyanobacterium]